MRRRPLVLILLSLVAGIVLSTYQIHKLLAIAIFLTGLVLLCAAYPCKPFSLFETLGVILTFLGTGVLISTHPGPDPLLESIIRANKRESFQGTVLSPVAIAEGVGRFDALIVRAYISGRPREVNWKARVTVYNHVPTLLPGQMILFPAVPRPFRNFQNPGGFDYKADMFHKGFSFSAPVSDGRKIVRLGKGHLPFPRNAVELLRKPIRAFLASSLSGPELAIYSAMVLGERNLITAQLREKFSRTGVSHVLAVSGLHIGLVAWLAFFVFKGLLTCSYSLNLRFDTRKISAFLACIPILAYVSLSGFQVSATRAMIMAVAFLWSLILGREKEIWSTLCLSGLIILFIEPHALFQISFQLSFLAVIGLIWFCPRVFNLVNPLIEERLTDFPVPLKRSILYLLSLGIITVIATVFLLPITVHYFHRISLVSFPTNFVVVPILGLLVIPAGLISAFMFPVLPGLAKLILLIGAKGITAMLCVVEALSRFSFSSIWMITPNMAEMSLVYGAFFCLFFWRKNKWAKVGLVVILMLGLVDTGYWFSRVKYNKELRVSFIDVGQGNSALVEFAGGRKMLIDGGGFFRETFDVGKMVVAPFLWSQKISKINYLVLTHPQADHMNGLKFIAETFDPEIFFFNGDHVNDKGFARLMKILEKNKVKVIVPKGESGKLEVGQTVVNFMGLEPSEFRKRAWATVNNLSLIVVISYGAYRLMFPGDIEKEAENILVKRLGSRLRSQILLVPHHGSKTSASPVFVHAVQPDLCVISCRGSTRFKFPDEEVLTRLRKTGCLVLRTDTDGMVRVVIRGNKVDVGTFRSGFHTIYTLTSARHMGKKTLSGGTS
ncbi:MAG: DNA internalization-related competence protein ComEC/Rec2 [Deltaproteobacteria bacterium]|nr:MAG: DNA internalization-related competence protein ComEC/Rec2 [Deltaproteobacteria bacterium]